MCAYAAVRTVMLQVRGIIVRETRLRERESQAVRLTLPPPSFEKRGSCECNPSFDKVLPKISGFANLLSAA